jgi:uncharacterized protein (TIGR02145 family)
MKKTLTLLLVILLIYSCSTTSDGNTAITTAVPAPPENLTGKVISSTAIDLTWTDRSTNETGFKIERMLVGGTFVGVATTATEMATYSDSGLTPSTTYIYRVYSYNEVGKSPLYTNELTLTTIANLPSITIGGQIWTTKNLDVTTYRDGTVIPQVTSPSAWANLTTGAWCYYENSTANGAIYGKLYNWYAVVGIWNEASKTDANQRKQLAPTGYHIPSEAEWTALTANLGDDSQGIPSSNQVVFNKMAEKGSSHWTCSFGTATNSSGFTGLPGGYRYYSNGKDYYIGSAAKFWSSSFFSYNGTIDKKNIFICTLDTAMCGGQNYNTSGGIGDGYSVRCLRD